MTCYRVTDQKPVQGLSIALVSFHPATFHKMKHSLKQDLSDKKKRGIMRDEKRTTQVTIPPAYKDEKLALETRIDGSTILNQCARPQNGPGIN